MNSETKQLTSGYFTVANGVWGKKDLFVNYYMIRNEETHAWALVDTGLKWSFARIKAMARELFGEDSRPAAIILTHGHFDHVGSLTMLAREWGVPIYVHKLELPYVTGKSPYPPADPTVGGGLMANMSWMYPKGPVDVHHYAEPLPEDNTIPGFPDWKYIHTPGHSPGHISLFRESDKVLIAGDAFVTTIPESAFYALSYKKHLSGPPKYFTCNWASAKISVLKLAALDPEIVATGHGLPMRGEEMRNALHMLSMKFEELAQPSQGRYVNEPAVTDETGVLYIPPATEKIPMVVKVLGVSLAVISVAIVLYRQSTKEPELAGTVKRTVDETLKRASERFKTLDRAFAK